MRLEKASYKAIKYACMNFHYAKVVPSMSFGYSVFNNKNEWCGVIIFNRGCVSSAKQYGFQNGEVCELIRMALNGNQESTSKALSVAVRLFKKQNPLVKLLISFADTEQNHIGTIYQAGNWFFIDSYVTSDVFYNTNNKRVHPRRITQTGFVKSYNNKIDKCLKYSEVKRIKGMVKHKYIYPLHKSLIPLCKSLSKPYPKRGNSINGNASANHAEEHVRGDVAAQ